MGRVLPAVKSLSLQVLFLQPQCLRSIHPLDKLLENVLFGSSPAAVNDSTGSLSSLISVNTVYVCAVPSSPPPDTSIHHCLCPTPIATNEPLGQEQGMLAIPSVSRTVPLGLVSTCWCGARTAGVGAGDNPCVLALAGHGSTVWPHMSCLEHPAGIAEVLLFHLWLAELYSSKHRQCGENDPTSAWRVCSAQSPT